VRYVEWLFRILALGPVVFLGLVYGEAWTASVTLGHWPIPSVEDPKALPTAALHLVSQCALLALLPAAVLFVVIGANRLEVLKHPRVWLGAFLASWTVLVVWPLLDPVTLEWWFD
jgi:hypothetical protein